MNTSSIARKLDALEKARKRNEDYSNIRIITYWGNEDVKVPDGTILIRTEWGSVKLGRNDQDQDQEEE